MDELSVQESIIATRARRANAGNRLKSLLEAEEPLDDEENIFMEFEDDQEFEVKEDDEDEEEEDEEGSGNEGIGRSEAEMEVDSDGHQTQPKKRTYDEIEPGAVSDDSNFSDSDDSSIEGGDSDDDEGEKELQRKQREEKRHKQKEKQKKILQLPTFRPAKKDSEQALKPKKQTAPLSANLLATHRRVSKREATIKNKQDVIERLQEQEARKANYIAPVVKKVRKLTQEERLAEAKITEERNTASLHDFFAQEEERKQKRRAAMLAKRIPMTSIIRYISSTKLVPPKRIFNRRAPMIVIHDIGKEKKVEEIEDKIKDKENIQESEKEEINEADKKLDKEDKYDEKKNGEVEEEGNVEKLEVDEGKPKKEKKNEKIEGEGEVDVEDNVKEKLEIKNENVADGIVKNVQEDTTKEVKEDDDSNAMENDNNDGKQERDVNKTENEQHEKNEEFLEQTLESPIEKNRIDVDRKSDHEESDSKNSQNISPENEKEISTTSEVSEDIEMKESEAENSTTAALEPGETVTSSRPVPKSEDEAEETTAIKVKIEVEEHFPKSNVQNENYNQGHEHDQETNDRDNNELDPASKIFKLQGPYSIRNKNTISLVNFPQSVDLTETKVKSIIFGPTSLTKPRPPRHRGPCAVTGLPSKYMDPQTSIPYSSMEAYKILNLVKQGFLSWNCEFGGLYTGLRGNQRHAKGVPEGFGS